MRNAVRSARSSFREVSGWERVGFLLLIATLVAAPIPYGSIAPAGGLRLQLLCFLTAGVATAAKKTSLRLPATALLPIAGIAVIAILQSITLPDGLLSLISPASKAVYEQTNRVLGLYGRPEVSPRISIAPSETVRAGLFVVTYLCAFISGAFLTRTRFLRSALLAVFLLNCVGHVIYATLFRDEDPRIHGTFVNPNHFAGYLEIGIAFSFAMLWLELVQRGRKYHGEDAADVMERRFVKVTARVIAWAVLGAGIAFTGSRMGIAATVLATAAMLLLGLAHRGANRRSLKRGIAAIGVLGAGALLIVTTTGHLPFLRFIASDTRDPASNIRFELWRISIDAWRNYPHVGSGLGTFREAFRAVQPQGMNLLVEQAHSDTLQLLVTGGWVGVVLAAIGIASLAFALIRRWWNQSRSTEAAFALGGIGALFSLLLHGVAEFNFSVPAIPATLAIFLGAAWSAAHAQNETVPRQRRSAGVSTASAKPSSQAIGAMSLRLTPVDRIPGGKAAPSSPLSASHRLLPT